MALEFSHFDTRNYQTLGVPDGYALWASCYDEEMVCEMDRPSLEQLDSVDWTSVSVAADLACGTGRLGSWLLDKGVGAVDGVDLTGEMLARARERQVYRALEQGDMRTTPLDSGAYGLVLSALAVGHIPQLLPLYGEAARLVGDQGWFVLVGYHWYFLLRGIPTHFNSESGQSMAIINHVHLMSDHVSAAHQSGWRLAELRERVVDDDLVGRKPEWAKYHHWPITYTAVWERDSRA